MNNARLWTIVNPTVGVPIFFLGVVITSLFVHFQVLTNTDWFGDFIKGSSAETSAEVSKK